MTEAAGERVFLYLVDDQKSSWGKVLIDTIQIVNAGGDVLVDSELLVTMQPSTSPTITPLPTPLTWPPTPLPSSEPTSYPTLVSERGAEAGIMAEFPWRQVRSTRYTCHHHPQQPSVPCPARTHQHP